MKSAFTTLHASLLVLLMGVWANSFAQISIPNAAFTNSQDFNTLASSGTSSTVPAGWAFSETGSNANTLYTASTGSNTAGDTYSFGAASDSDRAFGGLLSGSLTPIFGVCYTNNTGNTITEFTVSYTAELWRAGTAGRTDQLQFEYNTNTTGIIGAGTWTPVAALTYTSPAQAVLGGGITAPLHTQTLSSTLTGLSIAPGSTFCFRWTDLNTTGADDGIGIDDYSLSGIVAPPPCEVIGYTFSNISTCNDNGTPTNPADDYFTVNVTMFYSNTIVGDSAILFGGDLVFRRSMLAQVGNNVSSTFSTVRFRADGSAVDFTGKLGMGSSSDCSLMGTGPAVNSCSGAILPANDDCDNATPIACGETAIGSTLDANLDGPPSSCNGGSVAPDVWYTIVGTGGDITASLCGSSYDTKLDVFTGPCGDQGCVVGNDDFCGLQSQVTWASTLGTTYYIRVHGFAGLTGNFVLTITCPSTVMLDCATDLTVAACQSQSDVDAAFALWLTTTTATGGCNGMLTNDNQGAPSACGGSTMVNFTYTSTCVPLTTTCSATFTVTNAPPVVLNCPSDTTVSACLSFAGVNAAFNIWLARANASGGCGGMLSNNNQGIANILCGGSTTVTFTYTSNCFPFTTTCSRVFTVQAAPPVVLNCPADLTVTACQNPAQIATAFNAWLLQANANGGCGGMLANNNQGPPPICGGSTSVTFTYTSTCPPFTSTCTKTFTVAAPPPVVLTCAANVTVSPCLTQAQVNAAYATFLASTTASGGCGGTLTNNSIGAPLICSPVAVTRTVVFTYTSTCAPFTTTCTATFTLPAYPVFTVPVNGASTVACPSQIVQPVPPAVVDGCGKTVTPTGPVITNSPNPITCEGTRTFTFTYTDCAGTVRVWSHVTTVEYQDFVVPTSVVGSVECPVNAFVPTPPAVNDNCGNLLVPTGPAVTSTPNAQGCEGSRTYTFTYTDCEGNTHPWSQTFLFLYSADFFAPVDGENYVTCLAYAVPPSPLFIQGLVDFCGEDINISGPVMTQNIAPGGCTGWRTYSYVYTDCGGHSHPWNFTYYIDDNEAPLGTCPDANVPGGPGGPVAVNVSNLSCIEEVPCPADFDFSQNMELLLEAGNYFDVCDGQNVTVTLDSSTDLWECSDADGDGNFTFGRTFYFRIADHCGNEYPSLCEITFSGDCQPLNTFSMADWGIAGGLPGTGIFPASTDLDLIGILLDSALVVGGPSRTITITSAQAVVDLLPGTGGPAVLANCHQSNATGCNPMGIGGMKNALAANAIALELNIRYNMEFHDLTWSEVRSQGLGCTYLHPCIYYCDANGDCVVRFFDAAGTEHKRPFTIGGLQDLVDLYLGGSVSMTVGQRVIYGTALNQSLLGLNGYYGRTNALTACLDDFLTDNSELEKLLKEYNLDFTTGLGNDQPTFEVAPNPASGQVTVKMERIAQGHEVFLEIRNLLGQVVLRRDFGQVGFFSEQLDISGIGSGLYIISVDAGEHHYEQKLVVGKD